MKSIIDKIPNKCPECEGANFSFHSAVKNNTQIANGRLGIHDTSVIFFLGCNECSETLLVISGDDVANGINDMIDSGSK